LNKNPVEGFSAGLIDDEDIYKWEVVIIGPQDTLFEGGFFKAYLTFPYDYPLRPPKMKLINEIWHPNETIIVSVISMLADPNSDSPANVDAATLCVTIAKYIQNLCQSDNDNCAIEIVKWSLCCGFKRKVAHCVQKSQEMAFD
ncbi:unnamed protein product, partial [Coregonus sp. 'balchen']